MLAQLSIRNFALIQKALIDFDKGYTVITGETGSGKSILLGALNLILGERADYSVIRNADEKTIVEALFHPQTELKSWFDQQDIDWDTELLIRREITAQGKSRAFINDTPVQLSQLKELTEQLIYIHSQHETLELKSARFQFDLLDVFGDTLSLANATKTSFIQYKALQKERDFLQSNASELQKELDYIQFQLDELAALELDKHSFESYESELNRLGQVDDLRLAFAAVDQGLNTERGPLEMLRAMKVVVDKWKSLDANLASISDRLQSCMLELDDISAEAQQQLEALEMNPERFEFLTSMVDRFNNALRKHQLQSQEQLMELEKQFQEKVDRVEHSDEALANLNAQLDQAEKELKQLSQQLFEQRSANTTALAKHLMDQLQQLKLADTQIQFLLTPINAFDANGGMSINMLFSANKGMDLKPIEKAASGGELSRLMLAIQATLSNKKSLPTLILDEIDTGVSGEVALRIGNMLHDMGRNMQIIAISHLPQVAAKASAHFEVSKTSEANETNTDISVLTKEQRVVALAKLMSGDLVSEASLSNARLLMDN
ncbi:MAG: DNA repair protein RecN [Fluviicola sp.]|nr:DNA repair protein RecN [Fluviicola sp.]